MVVREATYMASQDRTDAAESAYFSGYCEVYALPQ
jgi:hypothetical protein